MPFIPDIDLLALVQLIGYPGIATIIFLESGVFFGFFLPGASLLFISGVLAESGIFNIWILLPLVGIAAVLGDNVGYWFGAKVGIKLFTRPDSRFFKQSHVDKTRIFFDKYGRSAVLLARFVPIIRTFTPILAGVGGMNYRVFFFYNIVGASVWACGVTLLGYFVGSKIPSAEQYITPIVLVIIAITCIPLALQWFKKGKVARIKSCPRAVIFDVDDTLTESFKAPKPQIVEKVKKLLDIMPVAIMSAAGFPRIEKEFLPILTTSPHVSRLYVFPNSTAQCYTWDGSTWNQVYDNKLTDEERDRIKNAIEEGVKETGILEGVTPVGQQIIDRGAQIAFAAIGIEATDENKKSWDVDKSKRTKLQKFLRHHIPEFEILIGGRTTLDVTKKGVNKAFGVRWLSEKLDMKPKEMLYVGDALYKGGNDGVVIPTGIQTASTNGPEETETIIDDIQIVCAIKGSAKNA